MEDQHHQDGTAASGQPMTGAAESVAPADSGTPGEPDAPDVVDVTEGGETACWAHLVCPECGAMVSEGHRQGCQAGAARPLPG
jgi:hypothetical protein